jgi:ribonuclease HI
MKVAIHIDGANEPSNPGGWATWAYVCTDENGREIARNYGCIGHHPKTTNNEAEYAALIEALKRATAEGWQGCVIKSDSQLVVKQVLSEWGCNAPNLLPMLREAVALFDKLHATILWIPREQNERADHLSRVAYNKARVTIE